MKESELYRIKEILTSIINAITSIVHVDITIADSNFNRIVSTGKHIHKLGDKIDEHSVFGYALKNKKSLIIENPRENFVCNFCKNKEICEEYAEVCCPILLDGEVIGLIGLIAFDEDQQREIIDNKNNLLNFLEKMSEIIGVKVIEERNREKIITQSKEVDILIDYIDRGVLSVNGKGQIKRYNNVADEMFGIRKHNKKYLNEIIKEIDIDWIFNPINLSGNHEFEYQDFKRYYRYVYSGKPIFYENKLVEAVLSFRKTEKLIDEVNSIMGVDIKTGFDDILGKSQEIKDVKRRASKASRGMSSILIQGESGTGKEMFARAIHINCAAIPENLLESELFGYEEGSFTGAVKGGKIGKFELADKGTIFLDEIGDMPIHLQSKLLRVLQEMVIDRVGGKRLIPIDVRIISATNKNLEKLVLEGQFREDLYYRLNVIPIKIPPLRDRKGDIEIFIEYFLKRYNKKLKKNIGYFSDEVINMFNSWDWKGNVRELENIVEYSVNMCSGELISIFDLPERIRAVDKQNNKCESVRNICEVEKEEIEKGLSMYGRKKDGIDKISELTGISRATLYRKMRKYDI